MEIQVVRFEEDQPTNYLELIQYDSEGEASEPIIVDRAIWERLEAWIAYRWGERQATWTISGCGTWTPHLGPTSDLTADVWDSDSFTWNPITPDRSPLGGFLFRDNRTYRVTATLGSTDPVPPAVVAAYLRLKDYVSEITADGVPAGVASHSLKIGEYGEDITRSPTALARGIHYSGSADLLRPYRRL